MLWMGYTTNLSMCVSRLLCIILLATVHGCMSLCSDYASLSQFPGVYDVSVWTLARQDPCTTQAFVPPCYLGTSHCVDSLSCQGWWTNVGRDTCPTCALVLTLVSDVSALVSMEACDSFSVSRCCSFSCVSSSCLRSSVLVRPSSVLAALPFSFSTCVSLRCQPLACYSLFSKSLSTESCLQWACPLTCYAHCWPLAWPVSHCYGSAFGSWLHARGDSSQSLRCALQCLLVGQTPPFPS